MTMYDDAEPRYVISVAARIIGVHTQTLRYYERAGLLKPSRSQGNTRFYSERDVNQCRRIRSLIDTLGVNLAGVEVIVRMADRMAEMERKLQAMEQELARVTGRDEVVEAISSAEDPEEKEG